MAAALFALALQTGCTTDFGEALPRPSPTLWTPASSVGGTISILSDSSGFWALSSATLLHSEDGGRSWQSLGGPPGGAQMLALAEDSSGSLLTGVVAPDALWRYSPADRSWGKSSTGLEYLSVNSLVEASPTLAFAGTPGWGVFRSNDGGKNWSAVGAGIASGEITLLFLIPGGPLLAATAQEGLYASPDSGKSWQVLETGSGHNLVHALCADGSGSVLLASEAGLFGSSDRGVSWQQLLGATSASGFCSLLWKGTLFAGTTRGVLRSSDGGRRWSDLSQGLGELEVDALASRPDRGLIAGTKRGIYTTLPGWIP
jgi:photosystem II stability/assembly factor-like uncharacterized protein